MLRTLKSREWFAADGFPITVERREPQSPFPRHKHEFSEIVIITGGKGGHVVGRDSWTLTAGDVFVMAGPQVHAYRDLDNLRLVNILFQPGKLKFDPSDLTSLPGYYSLFASKAGAGKRHRMQNRLHLSPQELDSLLILVEQLERELSSRQPGFGLMARALFMQIVASISRLYTRGRRPGVKHLLRLAETITRLERDPVRKVRLGDLAVEAGMSTRSFVRAFRATTGLSPISYLIQLRVTRAAALLRNTAEPITQVAFSVGFNDSNYFTRQFVKLIGVPPRRYRQMRPASGDA